MQNTKSLPVVAIVGRPNVGKSTFFNRMIGSRKSLVQDRAGVTRDRVYGEADYLGRHFMLIDTGGFEPDVPSDHIYRHVREQALLAIDEADIILFFVDGREGLNPNDHEVAGLLRKGTSAPIIVVVNKLDTLELGAQTADFYSLGLPHVFPLSAETGVGGNDLLDHLVEYMPEPGEEDDEADQTPDIYEARIALIGRPNVGKSSLANRLLGQDRQIAHDMPGTTRDSVDLYFEHSGKKYLLVDTAGVRRAARITDKLEKFTVIKAFKALDACNTAALLIDPMELITGQEQRLAGMVAEKGKALVILVNKWDVVAGQPGVSRKEIILTIRERMPFVSYAPIKFISAMTGEGVKKVLPLIAKVKKQHQRTITTSELNIWLNQTTEAVVPPMYKHRPIRFLYMTQVRTAPPTFLIFVNQPEGVKPEYRRYLHNQLRKSFGFEGTPIRIVFRARQGDRH